MPNLVNEMIVRGMSEGMTQAEGMVPKLVETAQAPIVAY